METKASCRTRPGAGAVLFALLATSLASVLPVGANHTDDPVEIPSGPLTAVVEQDPIRVAAPLDRIPLFVRAGACLPLLPAETDTLTGYGAAEGLVHLADVAGQERVLGFGSDCSP